MKPNFKEQGQLARQQNQLRSSNPYINTIQLPLWKRLTISKFNQKLLRQQAEQEWYEGYDEENAKQIQIDHQRRIAEAELIFAQECLQDHKRLNYLLDNFLKRNGGYVDLMVIAALRADFGNTELDPAKFKKWIDSQLNNHSSATQPIYFQKSKGRRSLNG